jgi:hypothetical protein
VGDDVVICGGVKSNTEAALKYAGAAAEFRLIGDADHVGDIQQAVRAGFAAASQL